MPRRVVKGVLILVPILLGGVSVALLAGIQELGDRPLIQQPTHWVAFSATTFRRDGITGRVWEGRYHRGSDGSTRSETGVGSEPTVIAIKNMAVQRFYLWTRRRAYWTSQPMNLPPWGWQPRPRRMSLRMLREGRLLEGYEVITSRTKDRVVYEAPDLNFFALTVSEPCLYKTIETCGISHRDVQVGEQDHALFLPPAGEEIHELAQPGGIIRIGER